MSYEKTHTVEQETAILNAFLTENPRPTYRSLARRFEVSQTYVQRMITKHKVNPGVLGGASRLARARLAVSGDTAASLTTEVYTENGTPVLAITRETTMGQVQAIADETRRQYMLNKDNPAIAGGYLRLMRETYEMIGRWLGMDRIPIENKEDVKAVTAVHIVYDFPEEAKQ